MTNLRNTFTSCDDFANYILDSILDFGSQVTPEFNTLTGLSLPIGTDLFTLIQSPNKLPNAGTNFQEFRSVKGWLYDLFTFRNSGKTNPNEKAKEILSSEIQRLQKNAELQYKYISPSKGYHMNSQAKKLTELLSDQNIPVTLRKLIRESENAAEECYNQNKSSEASEHEDMAELYDNILNRISN